MKLRQFGEVLAQRLAARAGLSSSTKPTPGGSDLRDIEKRIEGELDRLDKMSKHSDAIRRGVDGISEEIRKAEKALDLLLRKAQSTLRALNVEVYEEEAERRTPIQLGQVPAAANDADVAIG